MRAQQIVELEGPSSLKLVDIDEPEPAHMLAPDGRVVTIDVEAAGVSFPEVLQSRGEYQFKPPLPFVPGAEVAGTVKSAPDDSELKQGDRVAAMVMLGGFAETAVAPEFLTFRLSDDLDAAQGAGLILNYHTAWFCLVTRGRLREGSGETVLVHGAAGGVGTATLQVAKGLGARTFAVVSSDHKEEVAREAGADEVFRSDADWKDQVKAAGGADLIIDPVGGDRFTDSLRSLNEEGRLVVVGFTGGSIPEVKVNRLLLNNTEVIGAGWGAYVMPKPKLNAEIQAQIDRLIASGHVRPIVGERFPLEKASDALVLIDERGATGKVVLDVS
jgi:NADPH2:quinone reductase